ncbi:MAG: LysM peptidoglycan-binding domain-containing protein, partial [Desulfuromonadales bacterium]|nr:LysM peptidoglycan-binding domain-containing protein [Desulfuromonadales bacterium]
PLSVIYQVGADETLWAISARREVYGDPLLWPLLYQANRDQIKDPRQIYPGQVLSIPRDTSSREREEAREKARRSDIFPVETLQSSPAPTKKGS